MQPLKDKTTKMFFGTENEVFDLVVKEDHAFRKLNSVIDFSELTDPLRDLYSDLGTTGIDIEKGFKALLLQFWEDYSDREMENAVRENLAIRWFCGFGLAEATPDHTYFCKLRKRLGTKNIADVFNEVNETLRGKGLFGDVFRFIDASAIVSKTALWEERDRAIKDGEEKLNNANVKNYAADRDARWGAKSKNNIWFGYKRHHNVDMKCGMIDKLAVTPANVPDPKALGEIITKNTMAFMDKIYDQKKAYETLKANRCHSGIIKKRNNKTKNKDLDSWKSKTRMPFEGNFSKLRKRAKFRSRVKVLMQCYFEAMTHNLKKAIVILPLETNPA
jgi:IS5 family transposase